MDETVNVSDELARDNSHSIQQFCNQNTNKFELINGSLNFDRIN